MNIKTLIHDTMMNAFIFSEFFEVVIPEIDKNNISASISEKHVLDFENESKISEKIENNEPIYIEFLLLNKNNNKSIIVEVYSNGFRYSDDGSFSEIIQVLEPNLQKLFDIFTKSEK